MTFVGLRLNDWTAADGKAEQGGLLDVQRHVGELERGLLVEAEHLVVDEHERCTAEAAGTDRGGLAQLLAQLGRAPRGVALVLDRYLAFERLDAADRLLAALGQGCPPSAKNSAARAGAARDRSALKRARRSVSGVLPVFRHVSQTPLSAATDLAPASRLGFSCMQSVLRCNGFCHNFGDSSCESRRPQDGVSDTATEHEARNAPTTSNCVLDRGQPPGWPGGHQRRLLAAPASITLLHSNDVYEIAPVKGQGGFAPFMTLLRAERARNAEHDHHLRRRPPLALDPVGPDQGRADDRAHQRARRGGGRARQPRVRLRPGRGRGAGQGGALSLARHQRADAGRRAGRGHGRPAAQARSPATSSASSACSRRRRRPCRSRARTIRFAPPLAIAEAAVKQLEEMGADLVVALTHPISPTTGRWRPMWTASTSSSAATTTIRSPSSRAAS